jgi:colanic acid biosynthesis glycosyl transferase WcaI
MRIGVVSEYFDLSGSSPTVLYNLVGYLREHHPDLTFDVTASRNIYRGEHLLPARESLDGIEITRIATPKSNRPSTLLRLAAGMIFTIGAFLRLLRAPRVDALLVVTNPPSLPMATRAIGQIRGIPYIYLVHDLYPDVANVLGVLPRQALASRVLRRLQKRWLHAAERTIVLGRCMRDYLVDTYSMPASRIEVIPNWGDPDEIVPAEKSRFREENKLDGVTVLYSGNFGMHQDFDVVLDAAGLLRDRSPDITFVLVGRGIKEEHITRRIEREGLTNVRIFRLVQQEEYSDLLAAADIGLVTLARGAEGIGVPSKFYSILASGRPTVAVVARNSEVALVLNETHSGHQVDPGDSESLAHVIEKLAASPAERALLGTNARKALMDEYTLEHVGERFYATLTSLNRDPLLATS